jgi:four helix bundle protein
MLRGRPMGVYRFEDLRVWQLAKRQSDDVGALLQRDSFRGDRKLADQLNAASISVPLNISEAFLRRRDGEMRQFLRYAAASNGETRAAVHLAEGRRYLRADEAERLIERSNSIGRMLTRWQQTLRDGPRTKD